MSDDVKPRNATEVTSFNLYTSAPCAVDSAFEDWYVVNAFDYVANPIGSRECGLQRKAWKAGHAAALLAQQEEIARLKGFAEAMREAWDSPDWSDLTDAMNAYREAYPKEGK